MQQLRKFEDEIFTITLPKIEKWRKAGLSTEEIKELNKKTNSLVMEAYATQK